MRRTVTGLLILGISLSAVAAEEPGQDRPVTPAEQYKMLLKAQELASSPGRTLSDVERLQFIGTTFRRWNEIAMKFVDLAEKYPEDPVAVDALIRAVWQVNSTPWPFDLVGPDNARAKAFALLLRDHIRSDKLGPVCERISSGFAKEYETFLRAVLDQNPHSQVQARACLALGHYFKSRSQRLDLIIPQPDLAKEFASLYGKEYLAGLIRHGPGEAIREAEALFERAARDYGDVKMSDGSTVGEKAKAELSEIQNLAVGKQAPEIEGEDQDGRRFKLSDHRGTVVLIDFWSEY
jgi:hypothetical protein